MRKLIRSFLVLLTGLTLVLTLLPAEPARAEAEAVLPPPPPLVTIRFNQANIRYDRQLYGALEKALAAKPEVMFDVISFAPAGANPASGKQWQAVAGRNTRNVITTMNTMGVPMERISVTGKVNPGLRYDETQIFVR